jgi:hypothetical protein
MPDDVDDSDALDESEPETVPDDKPEVTMSSKPKRARKLKPKATTHAKKPAAKSTRTKGKPGDTVSVGKNGRIRLPRRPRMAQETFRVTEEERADLIAQAMKEGAMSMSAWYRSKIGLPERA